MRNSRWMKVLCFWQDYSYFEKKYDERLARPVFVAMIINLWSLSFCILLLAVIAGGYFWEAFSVLYKPYAKMIFVAWCVFVSLFVATMHFVGMSAPSNK